MDATPPGGFYVTPGAMYQKLEDIDDKVNLLLERDKRDHERLKKVEDQINGVTKWVYFMGLPLLLLVSIVLGVDKLPFI
jgi:hypothetical protein